MPVDQGSLLPCPFCGKRELSPAFIAPLWEVSCTGCEAQMCAITEERVISGWNRRALSTEGYAVVRKGAG